MIATALAYAALLFGPTHCGTGTPPVNIDRYAPVFMSYPQVYGWADRTNCAIYVNPYPYGRYPLTNAWKCSIIVHEYGHLAGKEHYMTPNNIMYPYPTMYPPCKRRFGSRDDNVIPR